MGIEMDRLLRHFPTDVDAGLILGEANRRYFLGIPSSAGVLFVTPKEAVFFIDGRYYELAKERIRGVTVVLLENMTDQLGKLVKDHQIRTVGIDQSYVTVSEEKKVAMWANPAKISSSSSWDETLLHLRQTKNRTELRHIQEAQRLTDETFSYILERIAVGRTEKEIALDMEFYMRRQGAEAVAFDFIVAAGKNSSRPHAVPGENPVKKGDLLTMDFGGTVDGYCSDMTRTVAVGQIGEKEKLVYQTVLAAQQEALSSICAGVAYQIVDQKARKVIEEAGFGPYFTHSLGHSVGIEIHESPNFSPSAKGMAEPGVVMTVEPGIYLEGEFGVRIEDMGVITEMGFDDFTKSDKELIILP